MTQHSSGLRRDWPQSPQENPRATESRYNGRPPRRVARGIALPTQLTKELCCQVS